MCIIDLKGRDYMKKARIILLIIIAYLTACSTNSNSDVRTNGNSETVNQSDLPKPGDEDFIGPLEKDDWEKYKDEFYKYYLNAD